MNWWYDRRDWRRQKLQPWLSSESIILPKFSIKTLLPIDQIKDNKIWGCQQKSWDKFFLIKSGLNFLALMIFIYLFNNFWKHLLSTHSSNSSSSDSNDNNYNNNNRYCQFRIYFVLSSMLWVLYRLSHWIFTTALVSPIVQMRKVRHRRSHNLPTFTQQINEF